MILPSAHDTSRMPRRMNSRAASRATMNAPVRLTPITWFHWSSVMSTSFESRWMPALEHTMSSVPNCLTACANIACTSVSLLTSPWIAMALPAPAARSEEHTSELQSRSDLVCRLLLEKKKKVFTLRAYMDVSESGARSLEY